MSRVRFTCDIIDPAGGDHPDILHANKGQEGTLLERPASFWSHYVQLADGRVVGCTESEIKPVTIKETTPVEIRNAVITCTKLGFAGHPAEFLEVSLTLEWPGVVASFGGWTLDGRPLASAKTRSPSSACGLFVARILRIAGVSQWEQLIGRNVRVCYDNRVVSLSHITQDDWFDPDTELAALPPD